MQVHLVSFLCVVKAPQHPSHPESPSWRSPRGNYAGKSSGLFSSEFNLRKAQSGLSLLGGASSRNEVSQAEHHSLTITGI
jgi:hypothetical protein